MDLLYSEAFYRYELILSYLEEDILTVTLPWDIASRRLYIYQNTYPPMGVVVDIPDSSLAKILLSPA